MYKCDNCSKTFKQKIDYERHKNRKKPCTIEKFQCEFCKKKYKSYNGLSLHKKKCKSNPDNVIEIKDKQQDIKEFKCPHCSKSFTRKTHMYRHIRKYCNNIALKPYGNENMDWIKMNISWIMHRAKQCKTVEEFIQFGFENMHFNRNTLENANIKMNNKDDYFKRNMISIYKDNCWLLENNNNVMEKSTRRFIECIEDNIQSNNNTRIVQGLIETYDNTEDKRDEYSHNIKSKLYMLFHNFIEENKCLE
jgi:uncharacterized C2H2 Zn-finger protein